MPVGVCDSIENGSNSGAIYFFIDNLRKQQCDVFPAVDHLTLRNSQLGNNVVWLFIDTMSGALRGFADSYVNYWKFMFQQSGNDGPVQRGTIVIFL